MALIEKSETSGYIKIQTAFVMVLITLMIAIAGWAISGEGKASATSTQVQINTRVINEELKPDIKHLQDTKADKADIDRIYDLLKNIDNKLDKHMGSK